MKPTFSLYARVEPLFALFLTYDFSAPAQRRGFTQPGSQASTLD